MDRGAAKLSCRLRLLWGERVRKWIYVNEIKRVRYRALGSL